MSEHKNKTKRKINLELKKKLQEIYLPPSFITAYKTIKQIKMDGNENTSMLLL